MSTPTASWPGDLPVERVERKGLGSPDTLADGIAELASICYAQHCRDRLGVVLHHNLDKVAIHAGHLLVSGGAARYDTPIRVIIGGRASSAFAGETIPVHDLLVDAVYEQLALALPGYDHLLLDIQVETGNTSRFAHWYRPRGLHDLPELTELRCTDSAHLVACAPRTRTEIATLLAEAWLAEQPWAGSDVKVHTLRRGRQLEITARVPALLVRDESPSGLTEFRELLRHAETTLTELIHAAAPDLAVTVGCNTAQHPAETGALDGDYVTLSGSALDLGESGATGRGNDRHGLISPAHQAGNETTYGKDPTGHVGKVAAWLLDELAAHIAATHGPCRISGSWHIGSRFDDPALLHLEVDPDEQPAAEELLGELLPALVADHRWLEDLLDTERYRPRRAPSAAWEAELRHHPYF
ncbi:hypothetical protein LZ318_30970 [Saccharopolyspora indica]|uniref:methionine adenosyltransferase n=1 Tax=Saccharopolyspora indica TaxID=1229659 RepID=UPI0022EA1C4F|nr:methionine adenosyltransferase [Saccharopolyspora indica]MDA3644344.1 hypothetical protein [Saccharopolyspora indica]